MALSVVNNVASLAAQPKPANTPLNAMLDRLPSGLKVNKGVDNSADLVGWQQQGTSVQSLNLQLQGVNKAVSAVESGQSALNKVSSLLTQMRLKAQDRVNSAADRAEIGNAIGAIADTLSHNASFSTTPPASPDPVTAAGFNDVMAKMSAFGTQASQDMANLAKKDLSQPGDFADAVKAIDNEISTVTALRVGLTTFQANSLEPRANNLTTTLQAATAPTTQIQSTGSTAEVSAVDRLQTHSPLSVGANKTAALIGQLLSR